MRYEYFGNDTLLLSKLQLDCGLSSEHLHTSFVLSWNTSGFVFLLLSAAWHCNV